jgi:hypothetical protein
MGRIAGLVGVRVAGPHGWGEWVRVPLCGWERCCGAGLAVGEVQQLPCGGGSGLVSWRLTGVGPFNDWGVGEDGGDGVFSKR